jgi:Uncharacterized conserved protein
MLKRGMDSRGQLSVEYLFLLMVIIIVFGFMITNFIGPTIDASNDVSDVSAASNAINSIANAANMVYANGPMSKRTITYHVPFNMILTMGQTGTNTGYISSIITLSDGSTKIVNATTNYKMYPQTYNLSKGTHTAIISWDSSAYRMTVSTW